MFLDEPTSGLDLEAERIVVEALRSLMAGRTVVMATHRPALLALADRVLCVEAGTVTEVAAPPGHNWPPPPAGSPTSTRAEPGSVI